MSWLFDAKRSCGGRRTTTVEMTMYALAGEPISGANRYRCFMYFIGRVGNSTTGGYPSESIDAPDWLHAEEGAELITELSGSLAP